MAEHDDPIKIDPIAALAAASDLVRWVRDREARGADLLTISVTLVNVGASMGAGPDQADDYRAAWANWLRGIADDIEHGREIQIGNA
jgi:hypothetical protein